MVNVDESLKQVEIYEADLESVLETLQTVYRFCVSYDIFNQYKNLQNNLKPSPLTKQIDVTRIKVQGILDDHYALEASDDVPQE